MGQQRNDPFEATILCQLCDKKFEEHSVAIEHARIAHKSVLQYFNDVTPTPKEIQIPNILPQDQHLAKEINVASKKYRCNLCIAEYSQEKNLKSHKKKVHDEKTIKTFLCSSCDAQFNYKKNLNAHLKTKHGVHLDQKNKKRKYEKFDENVASKKTPQDKADLKVTTIEKGQANEPKVKCPTCDFATTKKDEIIMKHIEEHHGSKVIFTEFFFDSFEDFETWRQDQEKATMNNFPVEGKRRHVNGNGETTEYLYYRCHRNGHYNPKGKGARELKFQGSKKINGFCPASMKVTKYQDDSCRVKYIETHFGHGTEIEHMYLTKNEKEQIAVKLAQGIPHDRILDDIRDSVSRADRKYYISKKDLENWQNAFDVLDEGIYDKNAAISVDAWANEKKESGEVLYYKPQGVKSDNFDEDYFILIFVKQSQIDLLLEFSNDIVASDSTHGMAYDGFQLATLLVIDHLREGLPCAFMITNHITKPTLFLFYQCIRKKCGVLNPNTFMSDMEDSFYEMWCLVMGPSKHRLYCTWHVDRAWRNNLKDKIKKGGATKQTEAYKTLRVLLEELDEETFEKMLPAAIVTLKIISPAFGKYFETFYVPKKKFWAYCYRLGLGINVNMSLERFHGIFKKYFLKGKQMKRLDKIIYCLELCVKRRMQNYSVFQVKGKISSKIAALRRRHRKSFELPRDNISKSGNVWLIPSAQKGNNETYEVQKLPKQFCDCLLKCKKCDSCVDTFQCTCFDYKFYRHLCKHIHLVCQIIKSEGESVKIEIQEEVQEVEEKDAECISQPPEEPLEAMETALPEKDVECISHQPQEESLEAIETALSTVSVDNERIEKCKKTFEALLGKIETPQDISLLEKILLGAKIKFNALKDKKKIGFGKIKKGRPAKLLPQRKQNIYLKSTKKKRVPRRRLLQKPDLKAKESKASQMLKLNNFLTSNDSSYHVLEL